MNFKSLEEAKLNIKPTISIIKDQEGKCLPYIVTINSNILSLIGKGRTLQPWLSHGYEYIKLRIHGESKNFRAHILIAKAFIPNPDNKPCIDHINGIRNDNRLENLRWCTNEENHNFKLAKEHHRQARIKVLAEKTRCLQDKEL